MRAEQVLHSQSHLTPETHTLCIHMECAYIPCLVNILGFSLSCNLIQTGALKCWFGCNSPFVEKLEIYKAQQVSALELGGWYSCSARELF